MSKKEFDRLEVLLGVQSARLRVADACELLSVKRRQVFRLLAGLKHGGAASLVSKQRGRPSNNRLPEAYRDLALSLVRERYVDFGPTPAFAGAGSGGGEAGAATRLHDLARDVARLDDCGGSVDRPPPPSALPASAAPPARLLWRAGAD